VTPTEAAPIVKKAFPKILRLHLVGSSLRHGEGKDIDFVAVVTEKGPTDKNIIGFDLGGMTSDIFTTPEATVESFILEYGLGKDNIRWKMKAQKLGLKMNRYGLWQGETLVTAKMAEIAEKLGYPLKEHLTTSLRNPL
jgi:DNA polymerase/3'-5' exonuclease PolX